MIASRAQFNPVRPALVAALICAAPLLAVAALGVFGPWTDYMAHIARTRLPAYLGHTAMVTGVAAVRAGLEVIATEAAYARLATLGARLSDGIDAISQPHVCSSVA